eukprot:3436358-Amphidinium_carterae.1
MRDTLCKPGVTWDDTSKWRKSVEDALNQAIRKRCPAVFKQLTAHALRDYRWKCPGDSTWSSFAAQVPQAVLSAGRQFSSQLSSLVSCVAGGAPEQDICADSLGSTTRFVVSAGMCLVGVDLHPEDASSVVDSTGFDVVDSVDGVDRPRPLKEQREEYNRCLKEKRSDAELNGLALAEGSECGARTFQLFPGKVKELIFKCMQLLSAPEWKPQLLAYVTYEVKEIQKITNAYGKWTDDHKETLSKDAKEKKAAEDVAKKKMQDSVVSLVALSV